MDRSIEVKKDTNKVVIMLDKVLYLTLPEVAPTMRGQSMTCMVALEGGQTLSLSYEEAKRVKDALRNE